MKNKVIIISLLFFLVLLNLAHADDCYRAYDEVKSININETAVISGLYVHINNIYQKSSSENIFVDLAVSYFGEATMSFSPSGDGNVSNVIQDDLGRVIYTLTLASANPSAVSIKINLVNNSCNNIASLNQRYTTFYGYEIVLLFKNTPSFFEIKDFLDKYSATGYSASDSNSDINRSLHITSVPGFNQTSEKWISIFRNDPRILDVKLLNGAGYVSPADDGSIVNSTYIPLLIYISLGVIVVTAIIFLIYRARANKAGY